MNGFMPHGHCYLWSPQLIFLHSASDLLIAVSYYSIPLTLLSFVRHRKGFRFSWLFACFATFILACGTTHLMQIWNIWHSNYFLEGWIKALTAGVSAVTAVLLVKYMPQILLMRTPDELEVLNRNLEQQAAELADKSAQLELSNNRLQQEIQQRESLNLQLEISSAELKRSNEDLSQFASVASHDLQEPLRAIAGCLELLEARYATQLDARAGELIGHSVQGAKRMRQLILDLLDYSRVGSSQAVIASADSGTAVQNALTNLKFSIEEANAKVTVGPLPVVMADSRQLTQLFQNLLSNSIKYRRGSEPQISVTAEHLDQQWSFLIQDNGLGIEPIYFERIFGIFQRLHTRSEYPGTGIGLALCKKIVERHGGRIWIESEPGVGSSFHFTLNEAS